MNSLPANMPKDAEGAFAHIGTVTNPSMDDFKLMIFLEASGQGFYAALAEAAPTDEIRDLLASNGREELAHAHRLQKVIEQLSGEKFDVPEPADNPYYSKPADMTLEKEMLETVAQGEFGGEMLYEGWAASLDNDEVAKLLRQNGKEERQHGERVQKVISLLPA